MSYRSLIGYPAIAGIIALTGLGCASSSLVQLACQDPVVNEGLVLTVDLVLVGELDARDIQRMGAEEWFYSDQRRALEDYKTSVSVETARGAPSRGCNRTVTLPTLKGREKKELNRLAVIADYKSGGGSGGGSVEILRQDQWSGRTVQVSLFEGHLRVR